MPQSKGDSFKTRNFEPPYTLPRKMPVKRLDLSHNIGYNTYKRISQTVGKISGTRAEEGEAHWKTR
jgi:hypothetical protein